MPNNDVPKIDHEAAKKWAEKKAAGWMYGYEEHMQNAAACYLDAMARLAEWEATARKLTNGLCSDREELEGFIEEMVDILKGELAPLEARLDEATELIEKLLLHYNKEYWGPSPDETEKAARAFLAKHRKTGASDGE